MIPVYNSATIPNAVRTFLKQEKTGVADNYTG